MELKEIPVKKIVPNPRQPREEFDKESLHELASSMSEYGMLQPVIVRRVEEDRYQIVAGERRRRAAELAGIEKITAIVKDANDKRQMAESLIENVHRKELEPIEKGRATYALFLLHGIELKPADLKDTISRIETKEKYGVTVTPDEEEIAKICDEIAKSKSSIRRWIGSISLPKKVQEAEIKKPEEERVSEVVLERISTLPDEKMQKKAYVKVVKEKMSKSVASEFVTYIKKLSLGSREYSLKPESSVSPRVMEKVLELPEKEQEKALRQVDSYRLTAEEAIEHIEGMKVEVTPPLKEKWEKVKEKYEEIKKEAKRRLETPEAKKRGRLFRNWLAHITMAGATGSAFCPECGSGAEKLGWYCDDHGFIALEEALDMTENDYRKSLGGEGE